MTQGNETKVSNFDEFYNKYYNLDGYEHHYKEFYEAGAASRQDEVSKLQAEIDAQFVANCKQIDHIHKLQHDRDELRKRIDEIGNHIDINYDSERDDDQHSYWSGYNQALRELNDILKGKKDE